MKNFSEKSKRRNIKKAKKSPFRLRQGGISAAREGRKGNPLRGRKKTAACLKGPAEAIGQHRIDDAAEESCFAGRAGFLRVRSGSSRSAPGVWGGMPGYPPLRRTGSAGAAESRCRAAFSRRCSAAPGSFRPGRGTVLPLRHRRSCHARSAGSPAGAGICPAAGIQTRPRRRPPAGSRDFR